MCAYLYGWLIKILQDTAGNNFEVVKNRIKSVKTTERKSKKIQMKTSKDNQIRAHLSAGLVVNVHIFCRVRVCVYTCICASASNKLLKSKSK